MYSYVGNKEKFLLTHLKPRQGYKEALEAIDDAVNALSEEVMPRIVLFPEQIYNVPFKCRKYLLNQCQSCREMKNF